MIKNKVADKKTGKTTTGEPSVQSLMNALPDSVVSFDRNLKVAYTNHAAQAFFKLSEKKLLGKSMEDLLGKENVVFETVQMVVNRNVTMTLHDVSIKKRPVSSVVLTTGPICVFGSSASPTTRLSIRAASLSTKAR